MEIKFRGWFQGINGREYWTYGYLVKQTNGNWEIIDGDNAWTVDNVGQYTGLLDNKGKEIYEGDILYYAERNQWFKVFRVGGGFAVNTHQDDFKKEKVLFYTGLSDMQTASWISGLEIKGNIHDNPELLNMASNDYDITKEE